MSDFHDRRLIEYPCLNCRKTTLWRKVYRFEREFRVCNECEPPASEE